MLIAHSKYISNNFDIGFAQAKFKLLETNKIRIETGDRLPVGGRSGLRYSYRRVRSEVRFLGRSNWIVSPTVHHHRDVSSELC